jgi:hypothetical protein
MAVPPNELYAKCSGSYGGPLVEGQVAGDDDRAAFVALAKLRDGRKLLIHAAAQAPARGRLYPQPQLLRVSCAAPVSRAGAAVNPHLRVEVRKSPNARFATAELRMLTDPGTIASSDRKRSLTPQPPRDGAVNS